MKMSRSPLTLNFPLENYSPTENGLNTSVYDTLSRDSMGCPAAAI